MSSAEAADQAQPPRLTGLPAIEAAIWQQLARACQDRHHAWRTPALATVDAEGLPEARTVVLREVDAAQRRLWIYSDARAAKVAHLARQPQAVLLAWSPRLHWQLRLRLRVTLHTGGLALASRWARVKLSPSVGDYLSARAPGAPLDDGPTAPPAEERAHFAALEAEVLQIDWLELHRDGHRRACFARHAACWLQP